MKRIVSALAAMVMILALMPVATAEGEVTLRLEGNLENARVGETVTVKVVAENAPICTAYELIFLYDDTVLKPLEAKKGEANGMSAFDLKHVYGGKAAIKATGVDLSDCFSGNMTLSTVTFEVLKETASLYGTPLKICYGSFTKDEEGMQAGLIFGPKRIGGRVYVGEDERVTTAQAVELLRHLIGFPTENIDSLDCDRSGDLSIVDATLLLRELN